MRFWWVNQNQTFRHEFAGGYLWSPKRTSNDHRNPFYEFMREVAPGDIVFSFADAQIPAIGIAQSYCYECPKPPEFGSAGPNWSRVGWRVDVAYRQLDRPIRPANHMATLKPRLPEKYAPLLPDGRGLQSVYLTSVDELLANELIRLMGSQAREIILGGEVRQPQEADGRSPAVGQVEWEEHLLQEIRREAITETEKSAIILARRGQGIFKERVRRIEHACRVTKVEKIEHLRASHCKPWRDSNNDERLDGENGLLLTPTIDHLFDRGFISFESNGSLLISPVAHRESLRRMGIPVEGRLNVGGFSEGQRSYLEFHRERVFLEASVR